MNVICKFAAFIVLMILIFRLGTRKEVMLIVHKYGRSSVHEHVILCVSAKKRIECVRYCYCYTAGNVSAPRHSGFIVTFSSNLAYNFHNK